MLSEEQKYAILEKYKDNYTINEIADKMKINRKTVILWLKRYIETNNLERKKTIRSKKTTKEEDNMIINIIEKNEKFNLQKIKNQLNDNNIVISKTTIWRRLINNNYVNGNYLNKPKLTELQRIKRLEWAKKYLNYDWTKVLFSDEATIYLDKVGKCWYKIGNRKINETTKYIIKRNIWAFINLQFGLCDYDIFNCNLNADKYENILADHLVVVYNSDFIYQQDNHPVHKSKKIQKYFEDNNIKTLDWPPNSPDINPIENFWSLVKRTIIQKSLTNDNFEDNIRLAIENIDFSSIYNMISNMHVRIQKLIENNGNIIDY